MFTHIPKERLLINSNKFLTTKQERLVTPSEGKLTLKGNQQEKQIHSEIKIPFIIKSKRSPILNLQIDLPQKQKTSLPSKKHNFEYKTTTSNYQNPIAETTITAQETQNKIILNNTCNSNCSEKSLRKKWDLSLVKAEQATINQSNQKIIVIDQLVDILDLEEAGKLLYSSYDSSSSSNQSIINLIEKKEEQIKTLKNSRNCENNNIQSLFDQVYTSNNSSSNYEKCIVKQEEESNHSQNSDKEYQQQQSIHSYQYDNNSNSLCKVIDTSSLSSIQQELQEHQYCIKQESDIEESELEEDNEKFSHKIKEELEYSVEYKSEESYLNKGQPIKSIKDKTFQKLQDFKNVYLSTQPNQQHQENKPSIILHNKPFSQLSSFSFHNNQSSTKKNSSSNSQNQSLEFQHLSTCSKDTFNPKNNKEQIKTKINDSSQTVLFQKRIQKHSQLQGEKENILRGINSNSQQHHYDSLNDNVYADQFNHSFSQSSFSIDSCQKEEFLETPTFMSVNQCDQKIIEEIQNQQIQQILNEESLTENYVSNYNWTSNNTNNQNINKSEQKQQQMNNLRESSGERLVHSLNCQVKQSSFNTINKQISSGNKIFLNLNSPSQSNQYSSQDYNKGSGLIGGFSSLNFSFSSQESLKTGAEKFQVQKLVQEESQIVQEEDDDEDFEYGENKKDEEGNEERLRLEEKLRNEIKQVLLDCHERKVSLNTITDHIIKRLTIIADDEIKNQQSEEEEDY